MAEEPATSTPRRKEHRPPVAKRAEARRGTLPRDLDGPQTGWIDPASATAGFRRRGEIWRKSLHALPGTLPFVLALLPRPRPLDLVSQGIVVGLCVGLTAVFLSLRRIVQRPGEDNLTSTVLSYPATVIATMVLFPAHVELTGVVVAVLAFGDTAAYLGGRSFGRRPLPWNPEKTWAGSLAFLLASVPAAAAAYWVLAPEGTAVVVAVICGAAAAVAAAAAESLDTRLTDNLRVGLAAALAAALAHHALLGLTLF